MAAPEFSTLTADDLVTGEAVALDLPPASLGVRLASGLIDVTVTLALLVLVIMTFLIAALPTDDALAHVALVGTLVVVFLVFPTTVETLSRGKSLGKWAFGLRAVRDDAGPISFQHAFVRALVGVVEIYLFLGSPAFFSMLLSSHGKRLGDYAAGTYVVRERIRLKLAPPPPDADRARGVGARGRRGRPADRPGARRAPVPAALARPRPGPPGLGRQHARAAGRPVRRPATAREHPARGVPRGRHRHPP